MTRGSAAAGSGAAAFAAGHVNGVTSDRAALLRSTSSLELDRELARGLGKGSSELTVPRSDRAALLRSRSSLELSRELARGLGKGSGNILRSAAKLPAAAVADVAAAVSASRRRREQSFERIEEMLPAESDCRISGILGRQVLSSLGVTWQRRLVRVDSSRIWIGHPESQVVLDCIPINEIGRVTTKSKTGLEKNRVNRMETQLGFDLDADALFRKHFGSPCGPKDSWCEEDDSVHPAADKFIDEDTDDDDRGKVFTIYPMPGGLNAGKPTVFKVLHNHRHIKPKFPRITGKNETENKFKAADERESWIVAISAVFTQLLERERAELFKRDRAERLGGSLLLEYQRIARELYSSWQVQTIVGCVIFSSFLIEVVHSQIGKEPGSAQERHFRVLEWIFTIMFLIELLLNAFGHWFWPFALNGWNFLDTVVVVGSVAGLSMSLHATGAINAFRLVRVFRMVKMFREMRSLRVLIDAIASSIIPLCNAFVLFFLTSSMFAILATEFFKPYDGCDDDPLDPGHCYFQTFSNSLFTLFQVATGDSWASNVSRTLMSRYRAKSGHDDHWIRVFFVSYILINGIVLLNIVVAVLLDEFMTTVARSKANDASEATRQVKEALKKQNSTSAGPLDALVRGMLDFTDYDDLMRRITNLYNRLDLDDSGAVSLEELNLGLGKLKLSKPVRLSVDDFGLVTNGCKLLNADGELTLAAFEEMMLKQVRSFCHRKVVLAMSRYGADESTKEVIFALKIIMLTVDNVDSTLEHVHHHAAHHRQLSRKGRKEILNRLFRRFMKNAFRAWEECVWPNGNEEKGGMREGGRDGNRHVAVAGAALDFEQVQVLPAAGMRVDRRSQRDAAWRADEGENGGRRRVRGSSPPDPLPDPLPKGAGGAEGEGERGPGGGGGGSGGEQARIMEMMEKLDRILGLQHSCTALAVKEKDEALAKAQAQIQQMAAEQLELEGRLRQMQSFVRAESSPELAHGEQFNGERHSPSKASTPQGEAVSNAEENGGNDREQEEAEGCRNSKLKDGNHVDLQCGNGIQCMN